MAEATLLEADEAIARYGAQWHRLAERRGNAFITPAWFESWRRVYGSEQRSRVAVVCDRSGELAGLMAFGLATEGPIATARIAGANLGDWMHPVAAPEREALVAREAVAALAREEPPWRMLVLDNVDADAAWTRAEFTGPRGRRLTIRRRSPSVLPFASLRAGTYEGYLGERSPSFRKQLLRFDRRLERQAEIELRATTDPNRLEADLATFFRLHDARWESRGGSSLSSPQARDFHRDFAARALAGGWLRLLIMEADGVPIAAFYGWRLGERFAFYQAGMDDSWSKLSVGLVLHGRVIQAAIAEGAAEYDMLLGSEAYKFRFCDAVRRVETAVLTGRFSSAGAIVGAEMAARRAVTALPAGTGERLSSGLRRLARRLPTARRR